MSELPEDTADLRAGVPLHDDLLALVPLVGIWLGTGAGIRPATGESFTFGQQIEISHDGRAFLVHHSRSWLTDADGTPLRGAERESGFWRPGAGPDDVELVLATQTGEALVFAGAAGDARWELATLTVAHTPSAKDVDGERRLYAVRGDQLVYATELAFGGTGFVPHLNASLQRRRQPGQD